MLPSDSRRRGFTLVEMLVVLGIIAVLVALLMPAVMSAVNSGRRGAVGVEISQLDAAMQSYKDDKGDFPPNFRNHDAFIRHIRKCYPKIDPGHLVELERRVWAPGPNYLASDIDYTRVPNIDEGESLVFWLYLIDQDPRQPFKAALHPTPVGTPFNPLLAAVSPKKYFPFEEKRLVDMDDEDSLPSYGAKYSGNTCYLYLDSRSYFLFLNGFDFTVPTRAAYGEDPSLGYARPYWSEQRSTTTTTPTAPLTAHFKPVNPTSFQILCAGQDGDFGGDPPSPPNSVGAKFFPGGGNTGGTGGGYMPGDRDNMTNFSEGRRLEDHIP